jgi:hypothetical protein
MFRLDAGGVREMRQKYGETVKIVRRQLAVDLIEWPV